MIFNLFASGTSTKGITIFDILYKPVRSTKQQKKELEKQ